MINRAVFIVFCVTLLTGCNMSTANHGYANSTVDNSVTTTGLPEKEKSRLRKQVAQGDAQAAYRLFESAGFDSDYESERLWLSEAIKLGSPDALSVKADNLVIQAGKASSPPERKRLLREAATLIQRALDSDLKPISTSKETLREELADLQKRARDK
jgi:hypothetical protein